MPCSSSPNAPHPPQYESTKKIIGKSRGVHDISVPVRLRAWSPFVRFLVFVFLCGLCFERNGTRLVRITQHNRNTTEHDVSTLLLYQNILESVITKAFSCDFSSLRPMRQTRVFRLSGQHCFLFFFAALVAWHQGSKTVDISPKGLEKVDANSRGGPALDGQFPIFRRGCWNFR